MTLPNGSDNYSSTIFFGIETFNKLIMNSSHATGTTNFFSLTSVRNVPVIMRNTNVTYRINQTMTSAAFVCQSAQTLTMLSGEIHFFVVTDFAGGLVINVTESAYIYNLTTEIEINMSSGGTNTAGIAVNVSGATLAVNFSRLCLYSNADFAPLLARYSNVLALTLNMSYLGGWIGGANTASLGLIVGTTSASSNYSMNNSQVCAYVKSFANNFGSGSLLFDTTTTN